MFSQLAKQSVRFWSAEMPPTRAQMLHVPTELGSDAEGKKLWRPKAVDSVLSLRLGNWRIDRISHFYHIFVHFASYEDKSLLSEFF